MCLWCSHEINFMRVTHEIHFMIVTLMKYQTLTKSFRDGDISRNTKLPWNRFMKVTSHEISQNGIMKTPMQTWRQHDFHEGGCHGLPPRKESMAVKSHKNVFFVCVIMRGDVWQCTPMHYFHESKAIFCDVFCTLTKSLDSGSACKPKTK